MSTKTPTTTGSKTPKPPLALAPTATSSPTASLTGTFPITISALALIQPRARISSTHGPVTIGEGCVVGERALVGRDAEKGVYRADGDRERKYDQEDEGGVTLGKNVLIEAGAAVAAKHVGEGSVIGAGVRVGRGAVIGRFCTIAPLITIPPDTLLEDFTVVYGEGMRRVERQGLEGARVRGLEMGREGARSVVAGGGK